jgi:Cof subfamily protein (haloacid dehalogenase superfamily)
MPPSDGAPGRIRLLLSDVDGTLVTRDKQLTPRAIGAVERLGEAGIGFTITSSRPPRGLTHLIAPLRLALPIGGFNGGMLINPDLSVLHTLMLEADAAREAVSIVRAHDMDAWVYTGTSWLVRDPTAPHVAREEYTLGYPPTVVADFGAALMDDVGKIVAVGDDPVRMRDCNLALNVALDGRASATRSQSFFIDITHPDANKGAMVRTLSRLLSIPTAEIATIGDMENDVLMFHRSGFSIAMGNARPEVKAEATAVTDSNEEDGFAKAVERFLLERERAS